MELGGPYEIKILLLNFQSQTKTSFIKRTQSYKNKYENWLISVYVLLSIVELRKFKMENPILYTFMKSLPYIGRHPFLNT